MKALFELLPDWARTLVACVVLAAALMGAGGVGAFGYARYDKPAGSEDISALNETLTRIEARLGELSTHVAVLGVRMSNAEKHVATIADVSRAIAGLRVDLANTNKLLSEARSDLKVLQTR